MIFVYFMTTAPSFLVWAVSYFWFNPTYIENSAHMANKRRTKEQKFEIQLENIETDSMNSVNSIQNNSSNQFVSRLCESRLCNFKAIDVKQIEYDEVKSTQKGCLGTLVYFKKGILHIFHNTVCFTGLTHALFVCLFWKLMSGAEPLNLASSNLNTNLIPELDNLCAGEFTNLFYQYAWNNVFYVVGAIWFVYLFFYSFESIFHIPFFSYLFILVRTPPFVFFRYFWPCIGVFFAICITPLAFDVPYAFQVVLAAIVGVFPFYLYRYDEYLCTATVDNEYVGVLQALIGYIRYITPAVPGVFLAFGLVNLVFLVSYLVLFLSIVYSIYAAFTHKKELLEIVQHSVSNFLFSKI